MRIAPLVSSFCSTLLVLVAPALLGIALIAGSHDQEISTASVVPFDAVAAPRWLTNTSDHLVLNTPTAQFVACATCDIGPTTFRAISTMNHWDGAEPVASTLEVDGDTAWRRPLLLIRMSIENGEGALPVFFFNRRNEITGCIPRSGLFQPPSGCSDR